MKPAPPVTIAHRFNIRCLLERAGRPDTLSTAAVIQRFSIQPGPASQLDLDL
jgi:hypothetical protein